MGKKILILGNGFDLDIGMKSRYKDFMSSDIWVNAKKDDAFPMCNIISYLGRKEVKKTGLTQN